MMASKIKITSTQFYFTLQFVKRIKPMIGGHETDVTSLKFFGTCAEHVIEFKVKTSDDLMLLTCERCCILQCQKVSNFSEI